MPDRRERQQELERRMADLSVDLVFLPPSADLEYLTGFKRRILTFGNIEYAHSWVTGSFFAPGREPAFVLPRMVTAFDLPEGLSGDVTIVNELDDGEAMFFALAKTYGPVRKLALGARTWSDTTLKLMQAFGGASSSAPIGSSTRCAGSNRRTSWWKWRRRAGWSTGHGRGHSADSGRCDRARARP